MAKEHQSTLLEREGQNILENTRHSSRGSDHMAKRPEHEDDQPESHEKASTPQLDRLEKLANAAATAAQAKQWRARKNGIDQREEPSEVRNLSNDAEARARAEDAMRQMMAKPQTKRRGW
jgi:hypothetical protein